MIAGQGLCGRRTDRRQPDSSQGAEVAAEVLEPLEEEPHAVGRGEDQPVELIEPADRRIQRTRVGDRPDLHRRREQDLGTQRLQDGRRPRPFAGRAGRHDPLAEERPLLVPGEWSRSRTTSPTIRRAGARRGLAGGLRERGERRRVGLLRGQRPRLDDRGRRVAELPFADQGAADRGQMRDAHVDDQGAGTAPGPTSRAGRRPLKSRDRYDR